MVRMSGFRKKYSHGCRFGTVATVTPEYRAFQNAARIDLKVKAKENGLELYKFSGNHFCFSAVLKDPQDGHFYYVSLSDVRGRDDAGLNEVLYRTMKHEEDWTGGFNNYCDWDDLGKSIRALSEAEKRKERRLTYDHA